MRLQFVAGLNPYVEGIVITFIVATTVLIYRLVFNAFKMHTEFSPAAHFAIGSVSYLVLIFIAQVFFGASSVDFHLHDTYFVVFYSYPLFFISLLLGTFTVIYHWFAKISSKQMNNTLGYIHFWITFLSISFLLWPTPYLGLAGMPRRYYDYTDWSALNSFYEQNQFLSVAVLLLLTSQLLFVINFCTAIWRRLRRVGHL